MEYASTNPYFATSCHLDPALPSSLINTIAADEIDSRFSRGGLWSFGSINNSRLFTTEMPIYFRHRLDRQGGIDHVLRTIRERSDGVKINGRCSWELKTRPTNEARRCD